MTKTLDSTAVYAYTTLISAIVCVPIALGAEGAVLQSGAAAAIAKVRFALSSRDINRLIRPALGVLIVDVKSAPRASCQAASEGILQFQPCGGV